MTDRSGTPLVELRDISIAFGGIKAVDHVSVDLYPGEVVGLLGHNGAGKSTLIKCLSGAYKADAGQILINGQEVEINNPRDARHYNIETIYQTLALADNLDAASNLFLGRELVGVGGMLNDAAMEAETRKIMKRLNPNFKKFNVSVSALSGGQRQSVAIARALLYDPPILLLDEPTSAMDNSTETRFKARLKEILPGKTLMLVTHRGSMLTLVDRLMVIDGGKVVANGAKEDVLAALARGQVQAMQP